jgi:hypothetical protein
MKLTSMRNRQPCINRTDFQAILIYETKHPNLFKEVEDDGDRSSMEATIKEMLLQTNTFDTLFRLPSFKQLLKKLNR